MGILIEGLNIRSGASSFIAISEDGYVWDAFGKKDKKYKAEDVADNHGNLIDEKSLIEALKNELTRNGAKEETIRRKVADLEYLISIAGYVIAERTEDSDELSSWYDFPCAY